MATREDLLSDPASVLDRLARLQEEAGEAADAVDAAAQALAECRQRFTDANRAFNALLDQWRKRPIAAPALEPPVEAA